MIIKMFTGENCSACKSLKSYLDTHDFKYEAVHVATAMGSDEARTFNIRGLPTLVKLQDGKVLDTSVGFTPNKMEAIDDFFLN